MFETGDTGLHADCHAANLRKMLFDTLILQSEKISFGKTLK